MKKSDRSGAKKQASLKPPTYQPSKQEMNEKHDMPGASMKEVRKAFFKPLDPKRGPQKTKK